MDITEQLDTKARALSAHLTQFANREEFVSFVRERWKSEDGRYLERFERIELQF